MSIPSELELENYRLPAETVPFAAELARVRAAYSRRPDESTYSLFEPAQLLSVQERERKLLAMLARHGCTSLERARILEIGCGTGNWLRDFIRWGARAENLRGIDLLPERILQARALCPAGVTLECQNAAQLGAEDGSFDLVLQSTVFTSVLDSELKRQIAREMLRVLAPAGLIVWYDFHVNNPWNRDVRGVSKSDISSLFPGCQLDLERVTLAPPMARPVARISPLLYSILSHIKLLCTHYLGTIRKP